MPVPSGCWLLLLCLAAAGKQLSLQITPPCENEQHYEYSGRCCTKCEPGKYMSARCTGTSDSVCQPCGPNEYMDVWNEEDKCLLHKICDQGKALREVNPGNSTFQRQCACTMGYHWNEDCDCCQRNTICAPGFGVERPVQQDKDTMCIPCPRGYFSNVASSTDECKSWTNCTALGMAEIVPGTDKSDAVCTERKMPEPSEDGTNRILYVLIVVLFFVALIGIVIFIVYYKNKGKKLTADLQNWANEVCSQIKGSKEPHRDAFVTENITNAAVPQASEGMCLLGPTSSPAPGNSCCTSGHAPCRNGSPSIAPCQAGGNLQEFSVVNETDDDHFPPVPTEDEYTDKDLNTADYLSLLSRTASKTVSSFSEPMEAGENDSLNQYFSGIGSTEDITVSQGFHPSSNTDGAHTATDKLLQKSCQHAHSCLKETDNKGTDHFATNCDSEKICVRCGISYRESPRKWSKPCCAAADSASTSPETGSYAQCTCGLNFLSAGQSTLASDHSMEDASSDSTNMKYQNTNRSTSGTNRSTSGTNRSTSGTNSSTSDLPPASGNVTGNSNSTFISSGQVMNFKGDIIVVYLSQNSQEGATASGPSEENVGSPVQEENLSRCETFAGNTQHYKEKCAELQGARPAAGRGGHRCPTGDRGPSRHGQASQPVQEEGKLGHFSEKALN
ncbi:PREDICTED: tumor necrosis factor receptor superfamily member 11A [Haliaeetus leucocephalus]|uniref:tumor necrosis factor receptor superfamily member 11A n=1 Tax=Haliaeetus leucocephalus TaxID=52644 RepID=UPI00053CDCE9|nr:PREDICTED: tumor necrosis factor receptor superfamily member 11A [Haliaeetus leucocephalus]